MVYGECGTHPGNSMIDCTWCRLQQSMDDIRINLRDVKIDKILKENELHRGEDSKEGES